MKLGYTHITVVFDRSGSMSSIMGDMVGGLNTIIEEQKTIPGATFTLVKFDDQIETVKDFVPLENLSQFTVDDLAPRGCTALYDAVGKTINSVGEKLRLMDGKDRPEKVITVIITDGHENASQEYKANQIKQMITEQTDVWKWEFTFLGANQNAILTAKDLGIQPQSSISYAANARGTANVMRSLNHSISNSRMGQNLGFSQADYDEQTLSGVDPANNNTDSVNNNANQTNQIPSLNTQATQGQGGIRSKSRKIVNIVNSSNISNSTSANNSNTEVKQ